MKTENGQSLIEAMACLLIAGIILAIALPDIGSIRDKNQQTQSTNQLIGAVHYARNTAVLRRATVTLCSGTESCLNTPHWKDQILIFIDRNQNGKLDLQDELLQKFKLIDGFSWHWSNFRKRTYLQFVSNGRTRALNGTFSLCRGMSSSTQVVINLTGRVRTQTPLSTAACR